MPARRIAVVDPGSQRIKLLLAELKGDRVRVAGRRLVDRHEEGAAEDIPAADWISPWLDEAAPEALVLVLPQGQAFFRVIDAPAGAGEAGPGAALLREEAARIEELTGVRMDAAVVTLDAFAGHARPFAATFWREQAVQEWADSHGAAEGPPLDLVPGAAALAAAHLGLAGAAREAVQVDLGARQTTVAVVQGGQLVHALAFPEGSRLWTDAIAADRGCSPASAEVLKRSEDLFTPRPGDRLEAAVKDWVQDIEQTLADWSAALRARGALQPARWPVFLAGGGAAQPGLLAHLRGRSALDWRPWPGDETEAAAVAPALGALARVLGEPPQAASALPAGTRRGWRRERIWRVVLAFNTLLLVLLAAALGVSVVTQARRLAARAAWMESAQSGIVAAEAARSTALSLNETFEVWRPLLVRQRQSVEMVKALAVLRRQRTNDTFWYVLAGDLDSYLRGTAALAAETNRALEAGPRLGPPPPPNLPGSRALVAEIGLLPQGEEMRQALSELVNRLRASPPFRNVDILPPESRRTLVATNLAYPDRVFALELSLSESDLLEPLPVPARRMTNGPARPGYRPFAAPPARATPP